MNKKIVYLTLVILSFCLLSCSSSTTTTQNNNTDDTLDYRQLMREFVQDISSYAKGLDDDFLIIPQNGHDLLTTNGDSAGTPDSEYIAAIDGVGREDLFYGYDNDDQATPGADNEEMVVFMEVAEQNGVEALVTDYCSTQANMDDSYEQNHNNGFASFAADSRELDDIPNYPATVYNENDDDVTTLSGVKNFLYLLNPDNFADKNEFITAIQATNYDLILIDLYFQGEEELTSSDVSQLKTKANGGSRVVISYMSIGEAEDYRYYWESGWSVGDPDWLEAENPDWEGNYKVKYWDEDWQDVIFGNNSSYLKKIIDAGFDGVYLDIIDAFEYFEE